MSTAQAQDTGTSGGATKPTRPAISANRWQEDWSVLADPELRTQPFDNLKYIPLSSSDPNSYISLGLNLRERFEYNNAPSFGVGGIPGDSYLLQRLQWYVGVHINENWQVFTQFEDVRAPGKRIITPVDENPLDLRLAYLAYTREFSEGTFKARVGRQDFLFDLQRFVSSRDGPNVRQSFDAVWADWETRTWRFLGFISHPVQYFHERPFDDESNTHSRFSTLRVERHVLGTNELSAYYSLLQNDDADYLDASGKEERHILDARFAGLLGSIDWDVEAMGQIGTVGSKTIRAWAFGARTGYTFSDQTWRPRIGIQVDAASGDKHAGDSTIGTFNPLFPNGYYFTLAGYTGYTNLIHVKPSVIVKPADGLSLMGAVGLQWRQTTADAIYVQPNNPVPGTAGRGGMWTGAYGQVRAEYVFGPNLVGAIEAVHYEIGDTIRDAGGRNSNYVGVELKFGW